MKEFFAENWMFMVSVILIVVEIIITLLKKTKIINKTIDTPFERVLALLPGLIVQAENSGKLGIQKKDYVVWSALSILYKLVGEEMGVDQCEAYRERISDAVEKILETPQKKGIVYDDEEKKN